MQDAGRLRTVVLTSSGIPFSWKLRAGAIATLLRHECPGNGCEGDCERKYGHGRESESVLCSTTATLSQKPTPHKRCLACEGQRLAANTSQSHCVHVAGLPPGKIDRNQPSGALTAESLKECAETEGCQAWKWAYCANLKAIQFTAEADLLGGSYAEMYLFYSFTATVSVKRLFYTISLTFYVNRSVKQSTTPNMNFSSFFRLHPSASRDPNVRLA